MALVNGKSAKRMLETVQRQLGRKLTFDEFSRLIRGDNSVLSKKNKEENKDEKK